MNGWMGRLADSVSVWAKGMDDLKPPQVAPPPLPPSPFNPFVHRSVCSNFRLSSMTESRWTGEAKITRHDMLRILRITLEMELATCNSTSLKLLVITAVYVCVCVGGGGGMSTMGYSRPVYKQYSSIGYLPRTVQ